MGHHSKIPPACLSLVIPVYNEERFVQDILRRVAQRPEVGELVVVDDASRDGSVEKIRALNLPNLRLFEQPQNRGKGAAIRRGMQEARCPFVLIQDADLEYDPDDYPILLAPLLAGKADAVYGDRFHAGRPGGMRPLYYFANRFLTFLSNLRTGLRVGDMETCYKALRLELIASLRLQEDRFGIEPEITAELARLEARVANVPISYRSRSREEGKKIGWRDGWHAIKVIFRMRRLNP